MAETSNIDKIIADLGANYKDDKEVLSEILEEVTLKNCIKFSSNLQIIEYHQKNMEEIIHEIIN